MGNHIFRIKSSILAAFRKFSNSSKEDITGTVQCRFTGVFKNTNDEAYTDNLHGNVIADNRKRHRPQESEGGNRRLHRKRRRRQLWKSGTEEALSEDRQQFPMCLQQLKPVQNGNGSARHVDSCAERNRNCKSIGLRPSRLHKVRLTGIFAAELLVKNAYTPLSRIVVQTRG